MLKHGSQSEAVRELVLNRKLNVLLAGKKINKKNILSANTCSLNNSKAEIHFSLVPAIWNMTSHFLLNLSQTLGHKVC